MGSLIVPPGGAQFDFVESYNANDPSLGGATIPVANTAYLVLVRVGRPLALTHISLFIATQSGNLDVGIYSYDGTTFTRLAAAGSTAVGSGNAIQSVPFVAAVTLVPGINYYLAFAADNTTAAILRTTPSNSLYPSVGQRAQSKTASFPLPTTITAPANTNFVPWLVAVP